MKAAADEGWRTGNTRYGPNKSADAGKRVNLPCYPLVDFRERVLVFSCALHGGYTSPKPVRVAK